MSELQLPAFLEEETEEEILQRMLDALPDDIDKSEGSYIWDSLMPAAIEVAKTAEWAREILRRGFTSTTFGEYLDFKASERGLYRQPAEKATGSVTFQGTEGVVIPIGTRVATPSDNVTASIEFETTEQVTLDVNGTATAAIIAIDAGSSGNVKSGSITIIVNNISGVSSVSNTNGTSDGFDIESDEGLKTRILEENQKAEGAGNSSDYVSWAKQIAGVGDVIVDPLWNGSNTVRVIIIDRNGDPASLEIINNVQDYLDPNQSGSGDGQAPIGAIVTVDTVTPVTIDVDIPSLQITEDYTLDQVKQNIEVSLDEYFKSIVVGDTVIVKGTEAAIIQTPGVLDFGSITLNGARLNIDLLSTETAALGSVTYS
jgi:uncharacterized phage protein gp47/JayE